MDSWITDDISILAHRGYAGENPENTLAAVSAAAETADWVEVDVQRCRLGEIVVFHDQELDAHWHVRPPLLY